MSILGRRPAALCVAICLILSLAAVCLGTVGRIGIAVAAFIIPAAVCVIFRKRPKITIATMDIRPFSLVAGAMVLLHMMTSYAVWDVRGRAFEEYSSEKAPVAVSAVVIGVDQSADWYANYRVELRSVNGERSLPVGLVRCDSVYALSVGDFISFDAVFLTDEELDGIGSDKYDLMSDGINFVCRPVGDISITGHTISGTRVEIALLREKLDAVISLSYGRETLGLVKALMLADRSGLGTLKRDMASVGTSHLLALSGLHLTAVAIIIDNLLLPFLVSRMMRNAVKIICSMIFLFVSGFPSSLCRAAVMLTLMSLTEMFFFDRDRVTQLFLTGYLIVLTDPAAILDVGLQMSFMATLGVIVASEAEASRRRATRKNLSAWRKKHPVLNFFRKFLLGLLLSIFVSLGASLFVIPLQWLYFGEMSLLSVPATIILSPIITVILGLSISATFLSLFGSVIISGKISSAVSFLTLILKKLLACSGNIHTTVSLGYWFAPVTFIAFIAAAFFLVKDGKTANVKRLALFFAWTIFYSGLSGISVMASDIHEAVFFDAGTSDAILISVRNSTMLIVVEDGDRGISYNVSEMMKERKRTTLDALMLTRLSRSAIRAVSGIRDQKHVRTLILPEPTNDFEYDCAKEIAEAASADNTSVFYYKRPSEASLSFGDISVTVFGNKKLSRSSKPLTGIMFDIKNRNILYAGASFWEGDPSLHEADWFIVGRAGPKVKSEPPYPTENTRYIQDGHTAFTG